MWSDKKLEKEDKLSKKEPSHKGVFILTLTHVDCKVFTVPNFLLATTFMPCLLTPMFRVINKSGWWNVRTRTTSEVIWFSFKTFVFSVVGIYLSHEHFIGSQIRKKKKKGRKDGREERRKEKEECGSIWGSKVLSGINKIN